MADFVYDENYKKDFPCIGCGKLVTYEKHRPKTRVYCDECLKKHIKEHEEKVKEYLKIKVDIMHENAIRKMEKADYVFMIDYQDAIEAVRQMELMKPEAFLSAEEIIMAIILYEEGYMFKINHKILKYKVDFYIPEEKVILEIDSGMHDIGKCRAKDGRRDIELRNYLGTKWETVRIPASYVEKYPEKVVPAMIEIANKQRKLRAEHNGLLPTWYSKSTKAYYESISPDVMRKIYKK